MGTTEALRRSWLEVTLNGLDWLARRRGRKGAEPSHLALGGEGERAAFFFLRRKGYTLVATRWTSGDIPGDIDLLGWQGTLLCFIEVKTRSAQDAKAPEAAVDAQKRRVLRRLARRYVRRLPPEVHPEVRFDVVSVYLMPGKPCEIVHFENAFGWQERRED